MAMTWDEMLDEILAYQEIVTEMNAMADELEELTHAQ